MRKVAGIMTLFILLSSCGGGKRLVSTSAKDIVLYKYAGILGVSSGAITNSSLYSFIDEWYGTKYKYGGLSKSGVDCSGFCNLLYAAIYKKTIKRRASDMANDIKKVSKTKLKEGDLVFFNISKKKNSHVGIYLMNNKFVHASTSRGVLISSLDNPYYKKVYNKGGSL